MTETTALATITEGAARALDLITMHPALEQLADKLARSSLVPKEYQGNASNVLLALYEAQRLGMSPLMTMQHLTFIHGRPSWSATFLIAAINASRRFSPLRFEMGEPQPPKEYEYWYTEYQGQRKERKKGTVRASDRTCYAWARDLASGDVLKGSMISIEMAIREGWYTRDGSKWATMPEQMLQYRAASFFSRVYASDITLGLSTPEEAHDAGPIDVHAEVVAPRQTMEDVRAITERAVQEVAEENAAQPPAEPRRRGRQRSVQADVIPPAESAPATAEQTPPPAPPAPPARPASPPVAGGSRAIAGTVKAACERYGLPYPSAATEARQRIGLADVTTEEHLEALLAQLAARAEERAEPEVVA